MTLTHKHPTNHSLFSYLKKKKVLEHIVQWDSINGYYLLVGMNCLRLNSLQYESVYKQIIFKDVLELEGNRLIIQSNLVQPSFNNEEIKL